MDELTATTTGSLQERIAALGPWFQNLLLAGIETAPDHFLGDYPTCKWRRFAHAIPADLGGASVLDIGCNAGFYALEMKRRGAARVVGIDPDARYLAQAAFAASLLNLSIELRQLSVYEVGQLDGPFDIVLFMGVLYHLRHPLLALDMIREHVAGDLMVFQSLQRGSTGVGAVATDYAFDDTTLFEDARAPLLHFIEHRYAGDPTNWWIPNQAGVKAMLRSAGFSIESHPEQEVYLCRPGSRPYGSELPKL